MVFNIFELIGKELERKGTIFRFLSPVKINYRNNIFSIISKKLITRRKYFMDRKSVPLIINYKKKIRLSIFQN